MTTTKPAIIINSLSKTYKLYDSRYDRMKEFFHPFRKKFHRKHHVLKNLTFHVNCGEVVGIIGKNGSGKSTLLKILNSVVTPSGGTFTCQGRVTALLELGGGFHEELTGVQNVFYLGAIQGFSRKEMEEKLPGILDFADIGEYARQPVNTYSSGMYVRLAFSMAINIDPDILITDEALAVGDLRFQQKCFRRIREFKDSGKTIILCTHSMNVVKDFCTRAIWIQDGEIREDGDPAYISELYSSYMLTQQKPPVTSVVDAERQTGHRDVRPASFGGHFSSVIWEDLHNFDNFGTRAAVLTHAGLIDRNDNSNIRQLHGGEQIRILLRILPTESLKNVNLQVTVNGPLGNPVIKIRSNQYSRPFALQKSVPVAMTVDFTFPHLSNGRCTISIGLFTFIEKTEQCIHWVHDALIAEIANPDQKYKLGSGSLVVVREAEFELIQPDERST
jgi:lipopolysaccharide transport system ATP-binding protein/teichoic acid transport system ATP-binding protein